MTHNERIEEINANQSTHNNRIDWLLLEASIRSVYANLRAGTLTDTDALQLIWGYLGAYTGR
jgi:hypothetical protein